MGDPRLPETEMGTAANEPQFNRILSFIEAAKGDGARLVAGGKRADGPELGQGFFIEPTVDFNVTRFWTVGGYYLHRRNDSSFQSFKFDDNQVGVRTGLVF